MALHEKKKIMHRDIKLDNFMITNNKEIKIIDFGCSKQFKSVRD